MPQRSHTKNLNLLRFLAQRYDKQGWNVYSRILDTCDDVPEKWIGPAPDLVLVQSTHVVAVYIESASSLRDKGVADKWKAIQKNKNVKLLIVVRDRETSELAQRVAESNAVEIDCHVIKKASHIKKEKGKFELFGKHSKIEWIVILLGIVFLLVFLFLIGSEIRGFLKIKDFYQPHDLERQEEYLKKDK